MVAEIHSLIKNKIPTIARNKKMVKMMHVNDSEVTSMILKLISHITKNTLHNTVTRTQEEAIGKRENTTTRHER